ncbi:hypothetical protein JCM11641_005657 [Rhodosporidiobolus odoratus]
MTDFQPSFSRHPYKELLYEVDVAYDPNALFKWRYDPASLDSVKGEIRGIFTEERWNSLPSWLHEHRQVFALNQLILFAPVPYSSHHPAEAPRVLPLAVPPLFPQSHSYNKHLNLAFPLLPISHQFSLEALVQGCAALADLLKLQQPMMNEKMIKCLRTLNGLLKEERWRERWETAMQASGRRRISRNLHNVFVGVLYNAELVVRVESILDGTYLPSDGSRGGVRPFPFEEYPREYNPTHNRTQSEHDPLALVDNVLHDIQLGFTYQDYPESRIHQWQSSFDARLETHGGWRKLPYLDLLQLMRELQAFAFQLPYYDENRVPGPSRIFESIAATPLDGLWRELYNHRHQRLQQRFLPSQPLIQSPGTIDYPPPYARQGHYPPDSAFTPLPPHLLHGNDPSLTLPAQIHHQDQPPSVYTATRRQTPSTPLPEFVPTSPEPVFKVEDFLHSSPSPNGHFGSPRHGSPSPPPPPSFRDASHGGNDVEMMSLAREHRRIGWRTARRMCTTPRAWAEG